MKEPIAIAGIVAALLQRVVIIAPTLGLDFGWDDVELGLIEGGAVALITGVAAAFGRSKVIPVATLEEQMAANVPAAKLSAEQVGDIAKAKGDVAGL